MSWQETEKQCFDYIKQMYPDAILRGGSDAYHSDAYIPSIDKYIEIKDLTCGCRLGQFVKDTASSLELKIINQLYNQEDLILGAKQHNQNKKVEGFCIKDKNEIIHYLSFDSFFELFGKDIFLQEYYKRSGTRPIPKKDIPILSKMYPSFYFDKKQKRGFVTDSNIWDSYSDNKEIAVYYIGKEGEVRKRSKTKTLTYLYTLK